MVAPFVASKHDVTIFRENGLKDKTPNSKKGIADKGYQGEKDILCTPNSQDTPELRKFKVSTEVCCCHHHLQFPRLSTLLAQHHYITIRPEHEPGMKPSMLESKILHALMQDSDTE